MDIFTQNFFARMFVVVDDMKNVRIGHLLPSVELLLTLLAQIRKLINDNDKDPNRLQDVRDKLAVLSKQIILLEETLGYLQESLEEAEIPPEPPEQAGRSLYERLQISVRS